ncbi:hypothetical protein J6590_043147 [Homalodisca vitripennis]|nr:hypothetical protein J6590_043147 [Homalodisca vitripennis]
MSHLSELIWGSRKLGIGQFENMCLELGIKHVKNSPYYPNPSIAEIVNKNISVALRNFHSQNHTDWDTILHLFQVTFNSAKHVSIGTSQAEIFLGYKITSPLENDWNFDALLETQDSRDRQRRQSQALDRLEVAHQKVAGTFIGID